MSDIDRDALIGIVDAIRRDRARIHVECSSEDEVDAILPAVTQAIRAAEQRGREQAAAAIEVYRTSPESQGGRAWLSYAEILARSGTTGEEESGANRGT